jgi:hypothetical protein
MRRVCPGGSQAAKAFRGRPRRPPTTRFSPSPAGRPTSRRSRPRRTPSGRASLADPRHQRRAGEGRSPQPARYWIGHASWIQSPLTRRRASWLTRISAPHSAQTLPGAVAALVSAEPLGSCSRASWRSDPCEGSVLPGLNEIGTDTWTTRLHDRGAARRSSGPGSAPATARLPAPIRRCGEVNAPDSQRTRNSRIRLARAAAHAFPG